MARPATGRPTDQELQVLKVLWERGPSTVREVWEDISQRREVGLTSVLKIMQIMRDKELLIADDQVRPQVFRPARRQATVLKQMARDLIDRAFDGSTGSLLLHAIDPKSTTPEEMQALRKLLDQMEEDQP